MNVKEIMGEFKSLIENQQQEINDLITYLNKSLLNLDAMSLKLLKFDKAFNIAHILSNNMRLFVDLQIVYKVFGLLRKA